MSVQLDETKVNTEGNDVNVINQKIKVKVGVGSKIFEILLWVLLIIPGVVFLFKKIKADNYFQQLQQSLYTTYVVSYYTIYTISIPHFHTEVRFLKRKI